MKISGPRVRRNPDVAYQALAEGEGGVLLSLETGEVLGMLPDSHIQKMRVGGTTAAFATLGVLGAWAYAETSLLKLVAGLSAFGAGAVWRSVVDPIVNVHK